MKKYKLTLTDDMPIKSNDGFYDPHVESIPFGIFTDLHEQHWRQKNVKSLEALRCTGGLPIEDAYELLSFALPDTSMSYQGMHIWIQQLIGAGSDETPSPQQETNQPIPIRLPCPDCGVLHIDDGKWATKLHHTHACQNCGNVWRPAIVNTVGVQFLPGFKNDGT